MKSQDWQDGWKVGMLEAAKLLQPRQDALKQHVRNILEASKKPFRRGKAGVRGRHPAHPALTSAFPKA